MAVKSGEKRLGYKWLIPLIQLVMVLTPWLFARLRRKRSSEQPKST